MINSFVGGGVRRPAIHRRREGLLGIGCCLMLAFVVGCGSTVQLDGAGQDVLMRQGDGLGIGPEGGLGDAQGDGLDAPRSAGSGPGDAASSGSDAAAADGRNGRSAAARDAGGTGPSAGPGDGAGRGGATGRGVTKDKVYLGVGTAEDAGKWAESVGAKGISAGDAKAQVRAVVKDVERRGGLGGRKIEIVWHDYKTAQLLADPSSANQAACEDWTRDHQVFAVVAAYDRTLVECLRKTNTPLIDAGAGWDLTSMRIYQDVFKRYPNYYMLGAMLGDRFDRMSIERLAARDFLRKWDTRAGRPGAEPTKLGLLFPDVPEGYTSRKSVVKELARHGIKPASVIMYNNEGLGVQGQQNAVLRFRSDGVTHVIGARIPFMNAADSQGYYPRYFIGIAINIYEQNAPANQLRGAMAESITPAIDVSRGQDPGDPTSATTYCKKLMKAAGQSTSDRTTLWAMEALCDQFFFLKDAVDKSGELTTAGLQRGLEALGNRPSALTWKSHLGPGEHASARSMRDLAYQTECKCFVYTSTKTHTG